MKTTYILIPGLGDHKRVFGWFYRFVAWRWSRNNMQTRVFMPKWASRETYEDKYVRLLAHVNACRAEGGEVVLVGISAGAALGLLTYAQDVRTIRAFVAVCGFTSLQETDRASTNLMKLSWYQAADNAEQKAQILTVQDKKRMISFIPAIDSVIDPAQQLLDGATNCRLRVRGHLLGIVWTLLAKRRAIAQFVSSTSLE
jgi:pimeloyl-ACP methyl ester carboxylesterase